MLFCLNYSQKIQEKIRPILQSITIEIWDNEELQC